LIELVRARLVHLGIIHLVLVVPAARGKAERCRAGESKN
jgi:hypothetical protein